MRRSLERRLARRLPALDAREAVRSLPQRCQAAWLRRYLRNLAHRAAMLQAFFPPEDAGPALERALIVGGAAAYVLEGIGDTPQQRSADEALLATVPGGDEPNYLYELRDIAERFGPGEPPDRLGASPIELLAWCCYRTTTPPRAADPKRAGASARPLALPPPVQVAPAPPRPLATALPAARPTRRPCETPGGVRCRLSCRLSGAISDCRLLHNRGLAADAVAAGSVESLVPRCH